MAPRWGHFSFVSQAKAPKINFNNAAFIRATPATNEDGENCAPELPSATPSKGHDGTTPNGKRRSHRSPLADIGNSPASTVTLQSNVATLDPVETPRAAKHVRWAKTPSPLATLPADARVILSDTSSATLLGSSPATSAAATSPGFPDIAPKLTSPAATSTLSPPAASPDSTLLSAPPVVSPTKHVHWPGTPALAMVRVFSPPTSSAGSPASSSVASPIAALDQPLAGRVPLSRTQPSRTVKRARRAVTPSPVRPTLTSPKAATDASSSVARASSATSSVAEATSYVIITSDVTIPPPIMRSDGYLGNGRWAVDHVISHRYTKTRGHLYLLQFSGINPKTKMKHEPEEVPEDNLSKDLIDSYRAQMKARKAAQRLAKRNRQKSHTQRKIF